MKARTKEIEREEKGVRLLNLEGNKRGRPSRRLLSRSNRTLFARRGDRSVRPVRLGLFTGCGFWPASPFSFPWCRLHQPSRTRHPSGSRRDREASWSLSAAPGTACAPENYRYPVVSMMEKHRTHGCRSAPLLWWLMTEAAQSPSLAVRALGWADAGPIRNDGLAAIPL